MWWIYVLLAISVGLSITAIVFALTIDVGQEIKDSIPVQNEINNLIRTNTSVVRNTAKTPNYGYCKGVELGTIDFSAVVSKYVDGDRVLLTGQQNSVENGVYEVLSSKYIRASDLSSDSQVKPGAFVYAGGNLYVMNSSGPFSNTAVVTSPLSFTQLI